MIPVAGFDQVKVSWIVIQKEGYELYGFLLYTNSDRAIVDYLKDGMIDLDLLSGDKCAIFLIEPPSKNWIDYTQYRKHVWWNIYGKELFKDNDEVDSDEDKEGDEMDLDTIAKTIISNNSNCTIVVGRENLVALEQLIDPSYTILYNRAEAYNVARHFGIMESDIPCLIFFKDLASSVIWNMGLQELSTQEEVKRFFRKFFSSAEFKSLLKHSE